VTPAGASAADAPLACEIRRHPRMKITDVITHQLSVPVDEPFTSSAGWVDVPVGPGIDIDRDVLKRYRVA